MDSTSSRTIKVKGRDTFRNRETSRGRSREAERQNDTGRNVQEGRRQEGEREREMGDAEKNPSLVWMGEVLSIQSDP